jgi:hypothetical protein
MDVVRVELFNKSLKKLGATEVDLAKLEAEIASNPEAGDAIQGLAGARKIRFAMKGRGKSGGGRAIYVAVFIRDTIYLLFAYSKSEKSDLTADDRKVLKPLVEFLKNDR